jgi:uncharacterized protein YlxW (UPF0749 family)
MTMTDLLNEQTSIIGLVVAAVGGIIVKWLDKSLRQNTKQYKESDNVLSDMKELNESLQDRIEFLENKVVELEKNLNEWKERYYALVEEHLKHKEG